MARTYFIGRYNSTPPPPLSFFSRYLCGIKNREKEELTAVPAVIYSRSVGSLKSKTSRSLGAYRYNRLFFLLLPLFFFFFWPRVAINAGKIVVLSSFQGVQGAAGGLSYLVFHFFPFVFYLSLRAKDKWSAVYWFLTESLAGIRKTRGLGTHSSDIDRKVYVHAGEFESSEYHL